VSDGILGIVIDPALFQENQRTAPASDDRQFMDVGPLTCERGGKLDSVTVAYETWGKLNASRDNAIVVCHALSGDAHAIGWWDRLIGAGKAIDTDRFYVIGTNALGGCQGTTGPSSLASDGRPYGSRFPRVTVGDMVEVQRQLVAKLGIDSLHAVAGGSMGGMMALEWSRPHAVGVRKAWITASARAHSAMQIGFNETSRQAIMRDPKWRGGDYPLDDQPVGGLAVARMIGHISFLSEAAYEAKFGRRTQLVRTSPPNPPPQDKPLGEGGSEVFQVESYLNYQGDKFTTRFDANSLLVLTRAIDDYELTTFEGSTTEFLFTSFTSDWIYPPHQSCTLHEMAVASGCKSEWHNIELPYGHDAFLLDGELQGELVRAFL
jgi:homoserine O-acetyltransferase